MSGHGEVLRFVKELERDYTVERGTRHFIIRDTATGRRLATIAATPGSGYWKKMALASIRRAQR